MCELIFPDRFPHYAWTVQSAYSNFFESREYACLGVTCHLQFWQNDRGLLRATAVTRGGTDTERESALKMKILPPFLPGLELATFRSRSGAVPARYRGSPTVLVKSQSQIK